MILQLDTILFQWFNSWVGISKFIDWTIIFRSSHLIYVVLFALALFWVIPFFIYRYRDYEARNRIMVLTAFVSAIIARFVITEVIRFFYDRPRPFEVLAGVQQLVDHPMGSSFPSGHAAFSFAVAAVVASYYPKTSILFFIAALNIGMARVAAGVHWPSDVFAGAIVGIGSAWLLQVVCDRYFKNKSPGGA